MKTLLLTLFITLFGANLAHAVGDEGFSDPQSAATAFLTPLTKGFGGISESVKALPGEKAVDNKLIAEAKKENPVRPMEAAMNSVLRSSGKLMYFRKTSEEVRLGGKMVKQFYELFFTNGPKKELMLVILQPTMSGGYHIMDAQITDDMSASPDSNKK